MKVNPASVVTATALCVLTHCSWTCLLVQVVPGAQAFTSPRGASYKTPRCLGADVSLSSSSSAFQRRVQLQPFVSTASISRQSGTTTSLSVTRSAINGESTQNHPSPLNPFLSAALLIALDIAFRKSFKTLAISFPSSLAGCCLLLASMLTIPVVGPNLFQTLSPGAALLAKWLPVFFVPSLITLPLVDSIGPFTEILKVLIVIVSGFFFTLLTTAGSVVGIRKLLTPRSTETGTTDNVDDDARTQVSVSGKEPPTTPKPFSKTLLYQLRIVMAASGVLSLRIDPHIPASGPILSIFLLATTLHNFCWGARLDKRITKVVHPLVTCTGLTWGFAAVVAKLTGKSFRSMLQSYKVGSLSPIHRAGAGDFLLFLLGPAVLSLAVSMYDRRHLMKKNWREVLTGVGISSMGGVFGTAAIVRILNIASPTLRLSLLSRNITSPLAMAIASILGADVGLAVAMVVVTGLIGANFGASILTAFGIQDAVARGMGMGAAAHGLGTAAFVNEKDAFPFAAISMALTATACTCLVSVPVIKRTVLHLALGV